MVPFAQWGWRKEGLCVTIGRIFGHMVATLEGGCAWKSHRLVVTWLNSQRFFNFGGDLGLRGGRKMTLRGVALDPQSMSLVALMATRFVTDLMCYVAILGLRGPSALEQHFRVPRCCLGPRRPRPRVPGPLRVRAAFSSAKWPSGCEGPRRPRVPGPPPRLSSIFGELQ